MNAARRGAGRGAFQRRRTAIAHALGPRRRRLAAARKRNVGVVRDGEVFVAVGEFAGALGAKGRALCAGVAAVREPGDVCDSVVWLPGGQYYVYEVGSWVLEERFSFFFSFLSEDIYADGVTCGKGGDGTGRKTYSAIFSM